MAGIETENLVIERARAGDKVAVKELYDSYSAYIYTLCARYLPDESELTDVMQDIFVKVFSSLDKFDYRGEGSLKAWIRQIAVNMCLKTLRRRKGRPPLVLGEDLRDVAMDEDEGPPDIEDVPAEVIQKMIMDLPDGYRAVLNLYALEDKSHKEIASLLGISESTSASQLHRARAILTKKIEEYKKNKR